MGEFSIRDRDINEEVSQAEALRRHIEAAGDDTFQSLARNQQDRNCASVGNVRSSCSTAMDLMMSAAGKLIRPIEPAVSDAAARFRL